MHGRCHRLPQPVAPGSTPPDHHKQRTCADAKQEVACNVVKRISESNLRNVRNFDGFARSILRRIDEQGIDVGSAGLCDLPDPVRDAVDRHVEDRVVSETDFCSVQVRPQSHCTPSTVDATVLSILQSVEPAPAVLPACVRAWSCNCMHAYVHLCCSRSCGATCVSEAVSVPCVSHTCLPVLMPQASTGPCAQAACACRGGLDAAVRASLLGDQGEARALSVRRLGVNESHAVVPCRW